MTIEADRAAEYLAVVAEEVKKGREALLAYWDSGHAFRKHQDQAADIAAVIGKSHAYVYDRMRIAGKFTRAQLVKFIDKNEVTTQAELLALAFDRQAPGERTRRGIHIPLTLLEEAEGTNYDVAAELRGFLSEVRLSELRAIITKFRLEREAVVKAAAAAVSG